MRHRHVQRHALSQQRHAGALYGRLKKLLRTTRILYVAAHPDDENTHLLAYLSKSLSMHVGYLSLTRGGGGQNLIGSEQGEILGLLRTQELLQARRLDGAVQFFSRAKDFGYSKSAQETLNKWNAQPILEDMVRVIRFFQPDVIITRFPLKGRTHGHHLASAILAKRAFSAAADPLFQRDAILLPPWTAKRLVHNISSWTIRRQPGRYTLHKMLKLQVGGYNPLLGTSYGTIAAKSRSMHKSQGFGFRTRQGPRFEYFEHLAGHKAHHSLFEGIDPSWKRYLHGEQVAVHLRRALHAFHPESPFQAARHLHKALQVLRERPQTLRTMRHRYDIQAVLEACLALEFQATLRRPTLVPGQRQRVHIQAIQHSPWPIQIQSVAIQERVYPWKQTLRAQHPTKRALLHIVHPKTSVSAPHWLRKPTHHARYHAPSKRAFFPALAPQVQATFSWRFEGHTYTTTQHLQYLHTEPTSGDVYEPTVVAPHFTVTPEQSRQLLINGASKQVVFT
ncbi:MAG: PIG-L family deacetylase, partial [Myxococcota bacterium]